MQQNTIVLPSAGAEPPTASTSKSAKAPAIPNGSASITSMAESLGVGRSQVVSAVQRLKASGRIARVGGKRGRWQVL